MNKQQLAKLEFEYDNEVYKFRKIIDGHERGVKEIDASELSAAKAGLKGSIRRLRDVQRQLYGWRFVKSVYGKDPYELDALRRRVLDLENQEIIFRKTLEKYNETVKLKEKRISELQSHLGSQIGFNPDPKEIKEAQEELLEAHREAGIAEAGLPMVQEQLKEARAELEAAEKKKKSFSMAGETYPSINEEIHGKACAISIRRKIPYEQAVEAVLDEDEGLAKYYVDSVFMAQDEE